MNKEKQELLDKCKKTSISGDVPILGGIYIIPTKFKHDSGYKIMYIVGHTPFRRKEETEYYLLDTCCDVVDFDNFLNSMLINDLHLDMTTGGIIHIWSNRQNMKSIFRVSSCSFEMVNKEKRDL